MLLYASSHNPPTLLSWELAQTMYSGFPTTMLGLVLPRLTLKYEEHWPPKKMNIAQVPLISDCRLADLSSSHSILPDQSSHVP